VDFRAWDEDTTLLSDMGSGGAVFWMDPDQATDAVATGASGGRTMVVAQLALLSTPPQQPEKAANTPSYGSIIDLDCVLACRFTGRALRRPLCAGAARRHSRDTATQLPAQY
jgi:hypothetical protein